MSHKVYSGIAQRDSSLAHEIGIATSRDSAVMRVIAAITMLFLPATFTAVSACSSACAKVPISDMRQTFFSTSFFDFNVDPSKHVYSTWLWLYWVVTLVLTTVVMAVAFLWWRRKENEMAERSRENRQLTNCEKSC